MQTIEGIRWCGVQRSHSASDLMGLAVVALTRTFPAAKKGLKVFQTWLS
jgi:hypothetical protein